MSTTAEPLFDLPKSLKSDVPMPRVPASAPDAPKAGPALRVVSPQKRARLAGVRITFVNRFFFPDMSATSQMLFDLTRRLARDGMDVRVVCARQLYDNNAEAKLLEYEVIEGVQVHRISTTRFGRGRLLGRAFDYVSFYATAALKLLEIVRRGDILVAKTDPPLISVVAASVAKWRGAKLVNWLQDLFPEVALHLANNPVPAWLDGYLRRLRDRSLNMAHANVAIGVRMKKYLLKRRVNEERLHVIENWADSDGAEPTPRSESRLRTTLGLQDKFVVAYSGNLGRAHDFETLLQAAVRLRKETDIVFLMIGGGAKMQQLKQRVADRRLPNFVFLPYQSRESLADSLAAADAHLACLLPALEGLIVPSKIYGILAAGRPTIFIGAQDGEVPRMIRNERCGKVVACGDYDSLIAEVWRLKLDSAYRRRLDARARALYLSRYTAEHGAQKWSNVLAELHARDVACTNVSATAVGT